MRYIKSITNLLTISRIAITMILSIMITKGLNNGINTYRIVLITAFTILIYITDYLDGRLARAWKCSSKFGARLDIAADFFYMISQDSILIYYGIMSRWILVLILIEFTVFMVSSRKVVKITGVQQIWFDRIGRITAVYYYAMPLAYLLINQLCGMSIYTSLMLTADLICIILTVAAIGSRLAVVAKREDISAVRMKNSNDIIY